jgi:hypothetical protein
MRSLSCLATRLAGFAPSLDARIQLESKRSWTIVERFLVRGLCSVLSSSRSWIRR